MATLTWQRHICTSAAVADRGPARKNGILNLCVALDRARCWMSLSRKRPQSDEEVFNQQSQDKETGQDDSESSH